jgi:hypothetical protein
MRNLETDTRKTTKIGHHCRRIFVTSGSHFREGDVPA